MKASYTIQNQSVEDEEMVFPVILIHRSTGEPAIFTSLKTALLFGTNGWVISESYYPLSNWKVAPEGTIITITQHK